MKKVWLFILVFCLFSLGLVAQGNRKRGSAGSYASPSNKILVQLGLGWGLAQPDLAGLNEVVSRFNQIRSTGESLEEFDLLQGPAVNLTTYGNMGENGLRFMLDLSYQGLWRSRTVQDQLSNIDTDLRVNWHSLGLGIGTVPLQTTNFDIGILFSAEAGIHYLHIGEVGQEREKLSQQNTFALSVSLPIYIGFAAEVPMSLSLRPYYRYSFSEIDYQTLDGALLNAEFLPVTESNSFRSTPHHFGLTLQWNFALHKNYYL